MMPDETKPADGAQTTPPPETPVPDKKASDSGDSGADKKQDMFPRDYVEELRKENETRRKEARELQKQLDALANSRKAEEDKKLADDQKWQELAKRREDELEAERAKFNQERLDLLRGNIAARYESRLPKSDNADVDPVAEFARRLQGSSEDELRADAEKLFAILVPKQPEQQQQGQSTARRQLTTVAPDGTPTGETDEQKRDRLYQRGQIKSPLFDPQKS